MTLILIVLPRKVYWFLSSSRIWQSDPHYRFLGISPHEEAPNEESMVEEDEL
jgi:hypothetical protein